MTMEELMALLAEHGISPHEKGWGTGEARTPQKLLLEVNNGECELISMPSKNGRYPRLVRRTHIAMIEVYRDLRNGRRVALVETAHVRNLGPGSFASPQSFVNRLLDVTITEKGMKGEGAFDTGVRALWEELQIELTEADKKNLIIVNIGEMFETPIGCVEFSAKVAQQLCCMLDARPSHPPYRPQQFKYIGTYPSKSFPGLDTESKAHSLLYIMSNSEQFALGYHDRDGNKLTTYDWRDTNMVSRR